MGTAKPQEGKNCTAGISISVLAGSIIESAKPQKEKKDYIVCISISVAAGHQESADHVWS